VTMLINDGKWWIIHNIMERPRDKEREREKRRDSGRGSKGCLTLKMKQRA